MRIFIGAALVAAQTAMIAQPAFAAEMQDQANFRAGAFGGLSLRVPFGGTPSERGARIGLALSPTMHSLNERGEARMRIGQGIELGLREGRDEPQLSLAGMTLADHRLRAAQEGEEEEGEEEEGNTTRDVLLIGAGLITLAAVAGGIWFVNAINESSE
jgi:hypothetical protein